MLELNIKDMLSVGFFVMLAYTTFRSLGRVVWVPYGRVYDPDDPFFHNVSREQWFWGHHRTVIIEMWNQLNKLGGFNIPTINIKPLAFLTAITFQWSGFLTAIDPVAVEHEKGRTLYYQAMPIQFRSVFVLLLVSTLYLAKEFFERTIEGIGEIIPL
jgi:hypothetical protein